MLCYRCRRLHTGYSVAVWDATTHARSTHLGHVELPRCGRGLQHSVCGGPGSELGSTWAIFRLRNESLMIHPNVVKPPEDTPKSVAGDGTAGQGGLPGGRCPHRGRHKHRRTGGRDKASRFSISVFFLSPKLPSHTTLFGCGRPGPTEGVDPNGISLWGRCAWGAATAVSGHGARPYHGSVG